MKVLTVKISDELDAALRAASRARGVSKSALLREALSQSSARQAEPTGTADRWIAQWRGRLALPAAKTKRRAKPRDEHLAHLLAKHPRREHELPGA